MGIRAVTTGLLHPSTSPEHTDAAAIEQFRRIYGAVGDTACADQTMLGRSRQAVQQRHDHTWNVAELSPPAVPSSRDVIEQRQIESALADRRRRSAADDADRRNGLVAW